MRATFTPSVSCKSTVTASAGVMRVRISVRQHALMTRVGAFPSPVGGLRGSSGTPMYSTPPLLASAHIGDDGVEEAAALAVAVDGSPGRCSGLRGYLEWTSGPRFGAIGRVQAKSSSLKTAASASS